MAGRESDEVGRLVCEMELNGLHLDVSIHLGFKSDSNYKELLIGIFCLLQERETWGTEPCTLEELVGQSQ